MSESSEISSGNRHIVAVIPARGGSKSIPHKNIAPLGGKPLLAWSVETARSVSLISRIIVSTDDEEIAAVARGYGAEVMTRPADLATDSARVIDALHDLIARLKAAHQEPDVLVLLEPTCPLRSAADIEDCLVQLEDDAVDSVATFKPAELNPWRAWRIEDGRPQAFVPEADPWRSRQELPLAYQLNGAVYAFKVDRFSPRHEAILFGRIAATVMPSERSVDIDGPLDLLLAEVMLQKIQAP